MSHQHIAGFTTLVVFAFILVPAQADTIYSNLGPGDTWNNGSGAFVTDNADGSYAWRAVPFTTGATAYTLDTAELPLSLDPTFNQATGNVNVRLASDSAGLPGTYLESSSQPVTSTTASLFSFAFSGSTLLQPNTTYWMVADATRTSTGSFVARWHLNTTGVTGSGRVGSISTSGNWVFEPNSTTPALRVNGTPDTAVVPLPLAGWAGCALLGVLGSDQWRRRRRRSVAGAV